MIHDVFTPLSPVGIDGNEPLDDECERRLNITTKERPMDTFTQPKITGYRQLTEAEAALMNEAKALAEQCGAFITKLRMHADVSRKTDVVQLTQPLDQRWISIGATDLQTGFMAVVRGIAQPTTF